MSLPTPVPGLVLRYNYLWATEAANGQVEASKERPAAIVMTIANGDAGQTRVYALPITHAVPAKGTEAMEIPAAVRKAAGLDAARAWVILSEFNEFVWPGFDLDQVPGQNPRTIAYGLLTAGFFARLRDRWLELDLGGQSKPVSHDE